MTPSYGKLPPTEALSAPLKSLLQLWRSKITPEGRLPARSDFEPWEFPSEFLPYLTLFDVLPSQDEIRFKIRLVGTGIVEETGRDTTGRYLDKMPNTAAIIERATWLVKTGKPIYIENQPLTWTSRDFKNYSALGVPLSSDGRTVDKIFYQMVFY